MLLMVKDAFSSRFSNHHLARHVRILTLLDISGHNYYKRFTHHLQELKRFLGGS